MTTTTATAAGLFCTFWVDDLFFGLDIDDVQEVMRHQDTTPVPSAPEQISGLVNLRGQIVTAVDLRSLLGCPPRPADVQPMSVVIRWENDVISLQVDRIGDVIDLSEADIESVPASLPARIRETSRGVVALDEALLLLLDPDHAING